MYTSAKDTKYKYRYNALQRVVVCCRCCSLLQCNAVCRSVLQCITIYTQSAEATQTQIQIQVQCVAVCCSVLQCVSVCCSVMHLCIFTTYTRSDAPCSLALQIRANEFVTSHV